MKYTIEIRDKAIEEMDLSKEYYHEQRVGLGDEFIKETFSTIKYIQQFPLHFHLFDKKYRQAKIDRFPFLVVYEFEEEDNNIVVISVFHTSRNPKEKLKK
jgi:plasmid stabilization system protein ParE